MCRLGRVRNEDDDGHMHKKSLCSVEPGLPLGVQAHLVPDTSLGWDGGAKGFILVFIVISILSFLSEEGLILGGGERKFSGLSPGAQPLPLRVSEGCSFPVRVCSILNPKLPL